MLQQETSIPAETAGSDFIVTDEWLTRHATKGCGWSSAQLRALGLSGSPHAGWKHQVIGTKLTRAQRRAFELGKKQLRQATLQSDLELASTVAQLSAFTRVVAALARDNPDPSATSEFLTWIGETIGRLAPGDASRSELRQFAAAAARFAAEFEAHAFRRAVGR